MKVGIIGVGVMGGSLLLNLRKRQPKTQVHTVSRGREGQQWSLNNGAASSMDDLMGLPHDLDFLFLTSPSHILEEQALELNNWPGRAIISDMASAKGKVVPCLDGILKERYLSCHPMCGSEKTGLEGAKPDLYNGKTVILTPGPSSSTKALDLLKIFWEDMGCRIVIKSPDDHDQAVAWVSHMPHLVVPAILQAIHKAEGDNGDIFGVAGTGLRDVSRLAGSNPELWKDIFRENQTAVRQAVKSMQGELQVCLDILDQDGDSFSSNMIDYLEKAKTIRHNAKLQSI